MKQTLLNLIGSIALGLSTFSAGYAQEAKTPNTKIIEEYPTYFAEEIEGIHYYLARYTSKKKKETIYLKVTYPSSSEISHEIYWEKDGDEVPDNYEGYAAVYELGMKRAVLSKERKDKNITIEDKNNYKAHLMKINKVLTAERERKKKQEEKEKKEKQ